MKQRCIIAVLLMLTVLPLGAQIFNFSLKTNNQQLIDKALSGAFLRINQSYELCDTVSDEHFGRNEKDYFSIIPFIGIETEKGLVFPTSTLTPWTSDNDFNEYKEQYKPIVTQSHLSSLNSPKDDIRSLKSIISGEKVTDRLSLLNDSVQSYRGMPVDSISGLKDGWLIWLTSEPDIADNDSVKFISIKKDIDVPVDGEFLRIETPEISGTVYGGVYVTPRQTGIGQLAFTLTGVMVLDDEGWVLDFPFIDAPKQPATLTPIGSIGGKQGLNQLKKKKK